MNDEKSVQHDVLEAPDLSSFANAQQLEEVRGRVARNRERLQAAQAEGLQPRCIDYLAAGQLADRLSKAASALDSAAGALALAGLEDSRLCRELTAIAERMRAIRSAALLIYA